ncbi:sugar ABC transporter ATP-binding protein [Halocella sp. SP3-1]|uniref:sugar ABC transporter ATP-binding protein n=1 Tax=Halocella sp. SP3-1 TaxID=2382161 RepID=UPI000F74E6F6|nr:sugar ABC transporter ATP-binding protein [Halocella sp. SP3-1]AZO94690.1 sugar ABC transporter ATP-binding protein [Halocella sp. SP3-1]MTI58412.1 sugar ABC transporter ATP-binding protein [Bacillota bacterium]
MSEVLLEIKNVAKRFGATQALCDVSLKINKGTVHSLLGRNGAGKSTLVNIIAGLYPQDNGQVFLDGKEISKLTVFDRQQTGIRLVTQHTSVIPYLSVGENIFMGLWPKNNSGLVDWAKLHNIAEKELEEYGLNVDSREKVMNLSPVEQRKVNIVRAMFGGAKLIILDEPTTALSSKERSNLFEFVLQLKEKGTSFIFITHYLNEAIKLSDDITVLRDGKAYNTKATASEERLANLVAGESVELTKRNKKTTFPDKEVVLECRNIYGENMKDVSFRLYRGEILGVVGFPGSGAREICRTLYGLMPAEKGEFVINNKKVNIQEPKQAIENDIAYISYDKHSEGIVPLLSIRENISLPIMKTELKGKCNLMNIRKEKKIARSYINLLKVKANSIEDKVDSLSGGNQQKVVVGKVLSSKPDILILDEPTVGIDIKSREEIISIVNKMTQKGLSVIYLTNDFDELLRVVDRLIFFREGQVVEIIENKELEQEDIIKIRDSVDSVEI